MKYLHGLFGIIAVYFLSMFVLNDYVNNTYYGFMGGYFLIEHIVSIISIQQREKRAKQMGDFIKNILQQIEHKDVRNNLTVLDGEKGEKDESTKQD